MLFNVIQLYPMLYQNICAFFGQFQLFLVPLHHQTCFTKNQSSCNIPTHIPILIPTPFSPPGPPPLWGGREGFMAVRSSPKCISPTFNHKPPGRNSADYWPYFPYIQPQTAWQKLRSLLAADPALAHLAALRRRSFLPAEVNIIYQHLGQP